MTVAKSVPECRDHRWERRLEVRCRIECVVACCLRCGRKELCWSRRPLPVPHEWEEFGQSGLTGYADKE
jgi:hypothetical protein